MQTQALINSPFAILTAVVAPAVLTNACSVLALGTSNRIARVVDRTRVVTAELGAAEDDPKLYSLLEEQLQLLRQRGHLLVRSLRFAYVALGGFATSALVAVIGGAFTHFEILHIHQIAAFIGLGIGAVSVIALAAACAMMIRETTMAIDNLTEEAQIYSVVQDRHRRGL